MRNGEMAGFSYRLPALLYLVFLSPSLLRAQTGTPAGNGDGSGSGGGGKTYYGHLAREFLEAHNGIRNALNEPPYVWNRTLALYARRWANTRRLNCDGTHSGGPYGENMFWGTGTGWRPADAVSSWAEEKDYYDAVTNSCEPGRICGHYTQIVWETSTMIGCARAVCFNGGVVMACSYDPPGNYLGESPFQRAGN